MKVQIKYLVLGFILACASLLCVLASLFFLGGNGPEVFRAQILPSGKMVKVTSFHLVWGVEHDERNINKDSFSLEYVSSDPGAQQQERDQEALEVFELIRSISEQWGLNQASLSAFQTTQRKGPYDLYVFDRSPDGMWTFKQYAAKAFISD